MSTSRCESYPAAHTQQAASFPASYFSHADGRASQAEPAARRGLTPAENILTFWMHNMLVT